MAKSEAYLINILRNITGRVDPNDPLFSDSVMLQYLTDFIELDAPQDVRLYKNYTWWEFSLGTADPDPYPVVLENIVLDSGKTGGTYIGPPAYADGFELFWYESPTEFYRRWPETQTYTAQRPQNVLYYNNELTFRGPPDQTYTIKIKAYQVEIGFNNNGELINDYLYRYLCLGAALNLFMDYGELEQYNNYYPLFMRARSLVYSRTNSQYNNQRPSPEF